MILQTHSVDQNGWGCKRAGTLRHEGVLLPSCFVASVATVGFGTGGWSIILEIDASEKARGIWFPMVSLRASIK